HKVTADGRESTAAAVRWGCDLNCGEVYRDLEEAVKTGLLEEDFVDQAVVNLMTMRMRLGMFDPSEEVPYTRIPYEVNDCEEHHALALEMARESIVLLKNDDDMLPLDRNAIKSIAVIGPNADSMDVLVGNYFGTPSRHVTLLQGIQNAVKPGTRVWYAEGSSLFDQPGTPWVGKGNRRLGEAVAAAERADVVILCMGLSPRVEGEEGDVANSDGGGDRVRIDLYDCQQELLEAVHATGTPIVMVLCNGSAVAISWADANVPAIVEAWYPGGEGGRAVAEVLFGDYCPGGRLPVTFYKSMDDLPPFTDYAMAGRTYRYFEGEPLYPFGFGLSYTQFAYSDLRLSAREMAVGASVDVSITVTNIGDCDGDEVVQLYLRDPEASSETPRHELRGFERVKLTAGESRVVHFTLTPRHMSLIDDAGRRVLEPGQLQVFVGGRQPGPRSETLVASNLLDDAFQLTGLPQTLAY
ncbi:MAG: glycoside hydrolase family 3 C-terminal domain-containing protein, partial [Lentisphaeria bacterium]|nr:glycoside hydrolase family 3 C-terminal domain-containing protein [Lentisphaeria bacterium]